MTAMTLRTKPWPAGVPCWADLTTPDLASARVFYGAVLGWDFEAPAGAEYGGYVLARMRGATAAGLGPLQQEGMPSAWTLYFASDDVEKTAASVTEHGGTVVLAPGQVGAMGSLLVALDPTGAAFGVWQAGEHVGAGIANEPGALLWEDLRSPDPERACSFYAGVFGFETHPLPQAGPVFRTFTLAGSEVTLGGIDGMGDLADVPPHWAVYFGVADVRAAAAAAESTGGRVVSSSFGTPWGDMAHLVDPGGATFWVMATDGTGHPDRGDAS
jgi:uncharacterized protein